MARAFAWGVAGWAVPGIVALPLAAAPEAAGGESVLAFAFVWILGLAPIGSALAGWRGAIVGRRVRATGGAYWAGLAGVLSVVLPLILADAAVSVVSGGGIEILAAGALGIVYSIAFGIAFRIVRVAEGTPPTAG